MKTKTFNWMCLLTILFLSSCEGSDTYRGDWKALNNDNERFEIRFEASQMVLVDDEGEIKTFNYSQRAFKLSNGKAKYTIQLNNGVEYTIDFPITDERSKGFILDPNGLVIFSISRDRFLTQREITDFSF